jgi:DNA-binding transcriptional LysR family regulator
VDELRGLVRGRVSVGATLPAGKIDVPRLLVHFSESFPGIEVDLHEGTAGDMSRYLEEDRVDAAFSLLAEHPPPEFEVETLSEEEVVAAFPAGAGPDRDRVGAADLAGRPLITPRSGSAIKRAIDDFFARAGTPMQISLESGDPFLLRCLVSTGFGAAVLPASLTHREGPPIDVRGLRPAVRLPATLIWRKNRHQAPAARAFIDFVRDSAAESIR